MAHLVFQLQKRISLILIAGGLLLTFLNLLTGIAGQWTPARILGSVSVLPALAFSLVFLLTFRRDHWLIRGFQVLALLFYSSLAVLDSYRSLFGYGLFFLFLALSFQYGYFRGHSRLKAASLLLYLCILMEYSVYRNQPRDFGGAMGVFFFLFFFAAAAAAIYRDGFLFHLRQEKMIALLSEKLKRQKEESKREIDRLQAERNMLENRIMSIKAKKVDLSQYHFTPKEKRIIEMLCRTNGTNKEIGYELNIAPGTVKQHMNRIFKKLHVKSRTQLISLCQGNFQDSD